MIPFPKRPKAIDLEDDDIIDVAAAADDEVDDLADTTERPARVAPLPPPSPVPYGAYGNFPAPPRSNATSTWSVPPAASPSSLAPVALGTRARELTFKIPRPRPRSSEGAWYTVGRPSMPWAVALVAVGAIGATIAHAALDAIDLPRPAAAAAPPPPAVALPLTPPAPAPSPVVLKFTNDEAVTVALPAANPTSSPIPPRPSPPPPRAAPAAHPSAPPPVASTPRKPPPAPPPASAAQRPTGVDSLADAQLKAALQ